jgi:hypothetical protein
MAQWNYKLDVKEPWRQRQEGEITIQQLAATVAKRLVKVDFRDEDINFDRDDFVDELLGLSEDTSATADDFDDVLARLYDFADEHRLWIATF